MTDVQALSGRIGELNQPVELWHRVIVLRLEGMAFRPPLLPLRLNHLRVIRLHFHEIASFLRFPDGTKKRSVHA